MSCFSLFRESLSPSIDFVYTWPRQIESGQNRYWQALCLAMDSRVPQNSHAPCSSLRSELNWEGLFSQCPLGKRCFTGGNRASIPSATIHYGLSSISPMTYCHPRVIGPPLLIQGLLPTCNCFLILLKIIRILGKMQVSQRALLLKHVL